MKNSLLMMRNAISYSMTYNKLKRFQKQYRLGLLPINVLKRCCNFELLEQKCREFNFSKI